MAAEAGSSKHYNCIIVGAGPGGLATAKAMKDLGVEPLLVLEASAAVGGVWRDDGTGLTWDGMKTNLSIEKVELSDLQHEDSVAEFPTAKDMSNYYRRYAATHGLLPLIQFHRRVTNLQRIEGLEGCSSSWRAIAQSTATADVEEFTASFVVVASGVFAKPSLPLDLVTRCDQQHVPWCHSGGLQMSTFDASSNVIMVGAAYSGADIAVAIANTGATVTVVVRTPRWYLPRYMCITNSQANSKPPLEPWDRLMEQRSKADDRADCYRNRSRHQDQHRCLASFLRNAGEVHPAMALDPAKHAASAVITDDFLRYVEEGKIRVLTAAELEANPELLGTLHGRPITRVVFATGYRTAVGDFLSQEILAPCEPKFETDYLPLLLYKSTLHPTMTGLGFVGLYRGPYQASIDVQARWLASLASKRVPWPCKAVIHNQLVIERSIRETGAKADDEDLPVPHMSPHPNYIGFTDSIAEEFGARPTVHELPSLESKPVIAAQYRLKKDLANGPLPASNPRVSWLLS